MNARAPNGRASIPARAVLAEAHASALKLVAAALLAGVALELAADPGRWPLLAATAASAALVAGVCGLLPWLWPRTSLTADRTITWSAVGLAAVTASAGIVVLGVRALLALQLLLIAAVLTELRGRKLVLASLWTSLLLLGGVIALYYALMPLRPVAD